jgi:hypothetical protein
LAASIAAIAGSAPGRAVETAVTCTNNSSGTPWQLAIDYGKSTVDNNPARISEAEITWHDGKDGGNYTLDRKSGALTGVFASSTGGYFLYHRCRLAN